MYLDKTEVVGRVALQLGNIVNAQAGMRHGLAHGDAVGVFLFQPGHVKVAGQCARAQKHGLVALAFFFGKTDDFKAERQTASLAVQLAHAGHRYKNAQAAVVLAAIAHGVKVRAGQQALGFGVGAVVDADHVADCVNRHVVKAAILAHPLCQALGAGTVCVGQVGHGQLAPLGVAGVAVGAQALMPVPHQVAEVRRVAKLVVQADFSNAVDVAQRLGPLEVGMVAEPAGKGGDDLGLG